MKYSKLVVLFNLSVLLISLASCTKDNTPVIEPSYSPTPYPLEIPNYATSYLGNMPIPDDNPMTIEGVELGRKLFFEKMLSDDFSVSCASCHFQENSFSDPNQFSQGTNGAFGDRNAMAIVNLGWSDSLFWDGRAIGLEGQAHDPVTNPVEMRNDWITVVQRLQDDDNYPELFFSAFGTTTIDSILVTKAIAQFERSMLSFNSPYDKFFYEGDTIMLNQSQKRGFDLFYGEAECVHCHSGPLLTDNEFRNNGLDVILTDLGYGFVTGQSHDNGKFKVPTLRNIAESAPYMHDGRLYTLEEVIEHYNTGVDSTSPNIDPEMHVYYTGLGLTPQEKFDLVNFLKSFSDTEFLENVDFSDPH